MNFNLDPNQQAQEVHFAKKIQKDNSQNLTFDGLNVGSSFSEKHFGLVLDEKLNFDEHIQSKISKQV